MTEFLFVRLAISEKSQIGAMSLYSRAFSKCVQIGERSGSNLFLRRLFSADAKQPIPIVKYEEILDLPNQPQKTLIDVREPEELKETGAIPCSINIPRKPELTKHDGVD